MSKLPEPLMREFLSQFNKEELEVILKFRDFLCYSWIYNDTSLMKHPLAQYDFRKEELSEKLNDVYKNDIEYLKKLCNKEQ